MPVQKSQIYEGRTVRPFKQSINFTQLLFLQDVEKTILIIWLKNSELHNFDINFKKFRRFFQQAVEAGYFLHHISYSTFHICCLIFTIVVTLATTYSSQKDPFLTELGSPTPPRG
jgi:hypothetical protein